eukprot:CFRG7573T1
MNARANLLRQASRLARALGAAHSQNTPLANHFRSLHHVRATCVGTTLSHGPLKRKLSVSAATVDAIHTHTATELHIAVSRSPTYIQSNSEQSNIASLSVDNENELNILWLDGHKSAYHRLWLRDNCQCSECIHPDSFQKLSCVADIGEAPEITETPTVDIDAHILTVQWTEEFNGATVKHVGKYPLEWLREQCRDSRYRTTDWRRSEPTIEWGAEYNKSVRKVDFSDFLHTDAGRYDNLHELHHSGIFLVENIPTADVIQQIAERIGPLRNTFYGLTWEVAYEPNPTNIASSSFSLPLHQDLQYFESPPGLQLLHCVSAAPGGLSEFVDGFAVVNRMKKEHPAEFDALVHFPVTYHYRSADEYRVYKAPIIHLNENGTVKHLKYSPPWEAPSDLRNDELTEFYNAYRLFTQMCRKEDFLLKFQLSPGDCVVFDNRRILHARTEFNPGFPRLLQGAYVDTCDFNSTYGALRLRALYSRNRTE